MKTSAGRGSAQADRVGQAQASGRLEQHKLEGKDPQRRRKLRKGKLIDKADEARMRVLVPYL